MIFRIYAGSFRWTGHDYIGEAGMYMVVGILKHLWVVLLIWQTSKKICIIYTKISGQQSQKMVHILPHWTHPKVELGTEIPVWVYSNCDEELSYFLMTLH